MATSRTANRPLFGGATKGDEPGVLKQLHLGAGSEIRDVMVDRGTGVVWRCQCHQHFFVVGVSTGWGT